MGVVMPARLSALACRIFIAVVLGAIALVTAGDGRASPREGMQVDIAVPIVEVSREQIDQLGVAIDVLKEINKVRTDPRGYADGLRSNPVRIRGIGSSDVTEALTFLDGQRPLPPLVPSPALVDIATIHLRDIGPLGLTSHTGSDGTTLGGRWRNRVIFTTTLAEELSFGQSRPREVVFQFLVDPGNPTRPHRNDLFNPVFTLAGAACGKHKQFGSACVVNFASPYLRDPPPSSTAITSPPSFNCPAGQSPAELDAWRRFAFDSIFGGADLDIGVILPDLARANETAYQAWKNPAALGLGIDPGGLWTTSGGGLGYCARPLAGLPLVDSGEITPGPGLSHLSDPPIPAVPFERGLDIGFDPILAPSTFLIEPLLDPSIRLLVSQPNPPDTAGLGDFTADDLTCEDPGGEQWARPRPVGGDYGQEAVEVRDIYALYSYSSSLGYTSIQAGINNLFDAPPPAVLNEILANSNAETYDFLGRYFYIGQCADF